MIKKIIKKIVSERNRIKYRLFFYKIRSVLYSGKKYYCISCNKSFRKFLDFGNVPRKNAVCPYCTSLERTRLVQYYLEKETSIFEKGKSILHFAPEQMLEKRLKKNDNNYISADINPALADVEIDITQIPFPEGTFDYVLCLHVLGHVPNESKAIDEIYRVLKPEGRAIILTLLNKELRHTFENSSITTPQERLKNYGESDLVRLHGLDFEERLTRKNTKVGVVDYRLQFTEMEQNRYRLGDGTRELIFDCKKLF